MRYLSSPATQTKTNPTPGKSVATHRHGDKENSNELSKSNGPDKRSDINDDLPVTPEGEVHCFMCVTVCVIVCVSMEVVKLYFITSVK